MAMQKRVIAGRKLLVKERHAVASVMSVGQVALKLNQWWKRIRLRCVPLFSISIFGKNSDDEV